MCSRINNIFTYIPSSTMFFLLFFQTFAINLKKKQKTTFSHVFASSSYFSQLLLSSSLSCRHSFHFSVSYCCFSFKFCFKSCFFLMIKNNKKEKKPFTDLPDRECLDTSGSVNLDLDERRSSNNSFKRIFL